MAEESEDFTEEELTFYWTDAECKEFLKRIGKLMYK